MSKILKLAGTKLSIWNSVFTRRPRFNANREMYVCVVLGCEQFRLASVVYRQNLYSGGKDYGELEPHEIPFSLFDLQDRKEEYPLVEEARILESKELGAGQCIFIPSFYYYESKTIPQNGEAQTILLSF
jgi:hypothetical protein